MDFQHNECKKIQCYVLTCPSVISYGKTLMLFQWYFISMYNLKTKLQVANITYNIKGHQNLSVKIENGTPGMGHHIGGMGHIKSGTPILSFNL